MAQQIQGFGDPGASKGRGTKSWRPDLQAKCRAPYRWEQAKQFPRKPACYAFGWALADLFRPARKE